MAPVCLHSSVIRGCVLNQPGGICQHNTVCRHSCWSPMEGLPQISRVTKRWPKVMQSDQINHTFLLLSQMCFLLLPETVGKLDRRSGKIESCWTWITQAAVALSGGKRAGSPGSHTVIIQCPPPSACLSRQERPALSLWMSRLQTGTVSGPLWYWLILPGRTR